MAWMGICSFVWYRWPYLAHGLSVIRSSCKIDLHVHKSRKAASWSNTALQSQKAVCVYFTSKQIRPFDFVEQCRSIPGKHVQAKKTTYSACTCIGKQCQDWMARKNHQKASTARLRQTLNIQSNWCLTFIWSCKLEFSEDFFTHCGVENAVAIKKSQWMEVFWSEWKLFRFIEMEGSSFQILLIGVICYL